MSRLLETDTITEVALYAPNAALERVLTPKPSLSTSRKKSSGKRRIKPRGISKLKKELDRLFSLYIRAKYPKVCYTCRATGKTLQNGHFVPRNYLATRWDENNCRPQCVGCNIWGRGQLLDFEENLIEELGDVAVSQLKMKRNIIWKLNAHWYETEILKYQQKLKELSGT